MAAARSASKTSAAAVSNVVGTARRSLSASKPPSSPTPAQPPIVRLNFTHEATPGPLNCTTHNITRDIVKDRGHALQHIIQQRLSASDRSDHLQWSVRCSVELSRRACVRSWAKRRVRVAFAEVLREAGYEEDPAAPYGGWVWRPRESSSGIKRALQRPLTGAVCVFIPNEKAAFLGASGAAIKSACQDVLGRMIEARRAPVRKRRSSAGGC